MYLQCDTKDLVCIRNARASGIYNTVNNIGNTDKTLNIKAIRIESQINFDLL